MRHHIPYYHAYGATETTPLVSVSRLKSYQQSISDEERIEERMSQGLLVPGLEMKVIDGNGEIPWDGEAVGRSEEHTSELQSRGHLVCRLLLEKKKKK